MSLKGTLSTRAVCVDTSLSLEREFGPQFSVPTPIQLQLTQWLSLPRMHPKELVSVRWRFLANCDSCIISATSPKSGLLFVLLTKQFVVSLCSSFINVKQIFDPNFCRSLILYSKFRVPSSTTKTCRFVAYVAIISFQ